MVQSNNEVLEGLRKAMSERILIIDGAMGTEIQKYHLTSDDFRGEEFKTIQWN